MSLPVVVTEGLWGLAETLFMLLVIKGSRLIGNNYLARKTIHMGAGLIFLSIPFLFSSPLVPTLLSAFFTLYTAYPRLKGRLYNWYQLSGNYGDIYFTLMATIIIPVTWYYDLWAGVIALLFMAVGDAVTGYVRWMVYGGRVKGLWGTLAMITCCVPVGYAIYGATHGWRVAWIGGAAGIAASLVEKFERVDDNITVPLTSLLLMWLLGLVYRPAF